MLVCKSTCGHSLIRALAPEALIEAMRCKCLAGSWNARSPDDEIDVEGADHGYLVRRHDCFEDRRDSSLRDSSVPVSCTGLL